MNKREELWAAIRHEEGPVPSWTMAFFNLELAQTLLGPECVMTDYLPEAAFKTGGASPDNRLRNLRYAQAVDNSAIGMGKGGNFAFGHGGPGEMMDRLLEQKDNATVSVYETGVKKLVRKHPHFYHHYDYPLAALDAAAEAALPDAGDPARYAGIEEDAAFYRARGFLPYANLNGIFSGIHYYFYPYDKLFMDMLEDRDNLKTLIGRLADFNLTAAEQLLRRGAEMITTCDDMGDGARMLFSPALYDELFAPYHAQLARLCHDYGAVLHLHSHGNIRAILPRLVDAGIDIINPFDPFETGDLREIKEAFGRRITLAGGMHRFFFSWNGDEMEAYMRETVGMARRGGGYIWMDSGGIPENITQQTYDQYREISRRVRG